MLLRVVAVVSTIALSACNCAPPVDPDAGVVDAGADAGPLFVELTFPSITLAPLGDELVVRAGHGSAYEPGIDLVVTVTGGVATTTTGVTDSDGTFRTNVTPDAPPVKAVSIQVTADDHLHAVAQSVDAGIADPGLRATYSTGVVMQEGPVRHGYEATCSQTGNNLYLGACTAVSVSPVNWAWGSFSATWEGLLRSPVTGDVMIQSWLWVDGDVHIVVDGVVVANLDTTGGGYSAVVPLVAGRWVPVSMSFAGNGGSNNMHLGWGGTTPALPDVWAPVPLGSLATPR